MWTAQAHLNGEAHSSRQTRLRRPDEERRLVSVVFVELSPAGLHPGRSRGPS